MSVSAAQAVQLLCLREPSPLRLAVAESMTGGRVQAALTAVPGASGYFLGGITAYSLDRKVALLGVKRAAAAKVNCVSAEVAVQMARGAARSFGADVAAATTGYAEPSPAQGVDAPFAWWAIARRVTPRGWRIATGRVVCPGMSRTQAQEAVAAAVVAELAAFLNPDRSAAAIPAAISAPVGRDLVSGRSGKCKTNRPQAS